MNQVRALHDNKKPFVTICQWTTGEIVESCVENPAERRGIDNISGSSAGTWAVLKKMMATKTVRRAVFLGCMLQLFQQVSVQRS